MGQQLQKDSPRDQGGKEDFGRVGPMVENEGQGRRKWKQEFGCGRRFIRQRQAFQVALGEEFAKPNAHVPVYLLGRCQERVVKYQNSP